MNPFRGGMCQKLPILLVIVTYITFLCVDLSFSANEEKASEKWKKKDVRDYTDADMERLYEQWEEGDDDELEPDELPEWKRPAPKIDLSQLNPEDPESMLKATKTGKTLMMFATISGNPTEKETESISQLWQTSLFNAHFDVQRYIVGSNRVLFVLKDGSAAWPIKDFLVKQERCEVVTIEGKDYPGAGSPMVSKEPGSDKEKKKSAKKKAKEGKATTKEAANEKDSHSEL